MFTVGLLATDGARMFDVAMAREVFSPRPDPTAPTVTLWTLAAVAMVELDGGLRLPASHGLEAATACDLVIVPGSAMPEQTDRPAINRAIVDAHGSGATLAALCTGAFQLAATGLLDGREATTHWRFSERLAEAFPRVRVVPDRLYAGADRLWTSAGVTAGVDLLLHLIRDRSGTAAATAVARSMVTPAYRPGSQAQYITGPTPGDGLDMVSRLATAVIGDPGRRWTLGSLAAEVSVSPRTLTREFDRRLGISPVAWLIEQRIRIAQELLEATDLSIEVVANRAGFGSADLLRKHFAARLRISPRQHRAMFRDREV